MCWVERTKLDAKDFLHMTFCTWLFIAFWNHTWYQLHLLPHTMKSQSSLMPKQGKPKAHHMTWHHQHSLLGQPNTIQEIYLLSSSEFHYTVNCGGQAIQKIWLPCHLFCSEKGAFCQLVVMHRLEVSAISSFKCYSWQDTHKRGLHIQHPPLLRGWRCRCCGRLIFCFFKGRQNQVISHFKCLTRAEIESLWTSKFWAVGARTSNDLVYSSWQTVYGKILLFTRMESQRPITSWSNTFLAGSDFVGESKCQMSNHEWRTVSVLTGFESEASRYNTISHNPWLRTLHWSFWA